MKKTSRVLLNVGEVLAAIFLTILVGRGFQARSLPDLKPWHRADLGDVKAGELPDTATLADYLRREDAVFAALREKVLAAVPEADRTPANRYLAGGPLDPTRLGSADGNRTFELFPEKIAGGALLLHGLTDAPYSVRPVAEALRKLGYYALAPRMPGHGTAPSGLVTAGWQDWMSVVRLAARHVRATAGDGKPFVLVGYSNGGALAVKYAQDVLEGSGLPRPDRIVLMSPMIGLTPFAGFARIASLLHRLPFFEKNAWLDVVPEYNPYKYSSFPANAAIQTSELTRELNAQTARLAENGRLKDIAPILAFQSLVDATVLTEAIVHRLFDRLPANGSELVLFDVNREDTLAPFVTPPEEALARDLRARTDLKYRLTIVTNARRDTRDVVARSWGPGPGRSAETALGLAWPPGVFSLSHVAIPFPESDDLYGRLAEPAPTFGLRLGRVEPRGERAVLTVPFDQWMRLTWNPFFPWLEARVSAWAAISSSAR
jgi:alpha-beta hydrolase superfamily lysophospholipase